jgi:hypothetical protein
MGAAKHLPGPYLFEPHNGFDGLDPDGEPWPFGYISTSARYPIFELNPPLAFPVEQLEATAILLASATELLEALQRLAKPAPGVKMLPAWAVGIARAAIAKATGEAA